MRSRVLALLAAIVTGGVIAACSLMVSLDGLAGSAGDTGADAQADGALPDAPYANDVASRPGAADVAPGSPISLVQASARAFVFTASVSAKVALENGTLLVAAVYWDDTGGVDSVTVSDVLGNPWTSTTVRSGNPCGSRIQIFYVENATGGADTVTATQAQSGCGTNCNAIGLFLLEYSGISTSGALDSQAGQTAPSNSNVMSTGTLSAVSPLDLVVAAFSDGNDSGPISAGEGFFAEGSDPSYDALVEDNLRSTTKPESFVPTATLPSGSNDNCWVATAVSFKAQ